MPVHRSTQQNCRGSDGPKQPIPELAVPWYCLHQRTNADRKLLRMPLNQRCTIMTNVFWFSQSACLCPSSCENNDARQMRMTDQETRRLRPSATLRSTWDMNWNDHPGQSSCSPVEYRRTHKLFFSCPAMHAQHGPDAMPAPPCQLVAVLLPWFRLEYCFVIRRTLRSVTTGASTAH